MSIIVLNNILKFLKEKNISFEHFTHEHVHTSADAAKIKGNPLDQAAKAIILRIKKRNGEHSFIQCVLPGNRKINFKILKKKFDFKSVSLATPEEVFNITDCTIGSVPPFGPLFNIALFVDETILNNAHIYFSAGTHNDSIKMNSSDYTKLFDLDLFSFSL